MRRALCLLACFAGMAASHAAEQAPAGFDLALVDMQGQLVGVNTAILSRTGANIGIGFAVPANLVARVVAAARAGHRPQG